VIGVADSGYGLAAKPRAGTSKSYQTHATILQRSVISML
jgi:hypothetical protein